MVACSHEYASALPSRSKRKQHGCFTTHSPLQFGVLYPPGSVVPYVGNSHFPSMIGCLLHDGVGVPLQQNRSTGGAALEVGVELDGATQYALNGGILK